MPLGGRPSLFFAPAKVPIAGMHVAGCAGGIFYSVRSMSHQYVSVAFDAFHQFGKPAVAFFMMYGRNTNQFTEIHDNKTEYAIIPRGDEWWNVYS